MPSKKTSTFLKRLGTLTPSSSPESFTTLSLYLSFQTKVHEEIAEALAEKAKDDGIESCLVTGRALEGFLKDCKVRRWGGERSIERCETRRMPQITS